VDGVGAIARSGRAQRRSAGRDHLLLGALEVALDVELRERALGERAGSAGR